MQDMTESRVDDLLAHIISSYAPQFGAALTKRTARKLASSFVEERVENAAGDAYSLAKTALSECGTVLEENAADGIIAGVILSGAANMNPAFLLLRIERNHIYLKACAKEGLMKQHTAERAAEVFKSALADMADG